MRRPLTASALFALVILATAATGQPPPADKKAEKAPVGKAEKKAADPTDAAIAAALATDPDVRVAKAKIQLAEAELAKARQVVTLKVLTLKATTEEYKVTVAQCEERAAWADRMVKLGQMTPAQAAADREKLAAAKAALARAETEWKLLTGAATAAGAADSAYDKTVASALQHIGMSVAGDAMTAERLARYLDELYQVQERAAVKGPIPDRIRAALDKPVKLADKGEKMPVTQALGALTKEAGLNVPVRCHPEIDELGKFVSEGEEMPLGAWLQLIEDSAVGTGRDGAHTAKKRFRFYVREYGLLFTATDAAPPDAPTLTEFWKQKAPPAAKDAKPETPK